MNIVISGLGIIGGSFAKAIKKYTDHYIIGINRSPKPLEDALACGAIDEIGSTKSLERADILILNKSDLSIKQILKSEKAEP